ncbi:MAG TPA: L-seryl-tRNA(Sec) selenium transferase [Bacillales bacterium]|nr:L-seryl-tRNA(Sec) selenium transferase [Bacillales bacterium]
MNRLMRMLPAVHVLQEHPKFNEWAQRFEISETFLTEELRAELQQLREALLAGTWKGEPTAEALTAHLFEKLAERLESYRANKLTPVINGTGVVLHTNLGRARLSDEAVQAVTRAAVNYSSLEFNRETGKRGSRHDLVEPYVCRLTGAEAAMVVNNNAAAVFLVLSALASDRKVIVSRGQLVEIGGSFRVSSIMEESGALLVEVGTTNKTRLHDYEEAVDEETAMIMKVHTSNFTIRGFTETVDTAPLAKLAADRECVYYEDLGSGAIYDFRAEGIGKEPLVAEVLAKGADLVSFSGDKLFGGPQAGIIAGKKQLIERLKKHQLARVLRVDKMTLAALEATMKAYLFGKAQTTIPVIRDMTATVADIRARAERFVSYANRTVPAFRFAVREETSKVGGGTMPDVALPTCGVTIVHPQWTTQMVLDHLRSHEPPVIGRVASEKAFLDFRTIREDECESVLSALREPVDQ